MPRLPQLTSRELVAFLESRGFERLRQSGSHLTLWRETDGRCVTIPVHTGCDLGRGLAARIIKDSGFTIEEFLRLR
jgi:predicted RNA binding protein YcfA (HicA-like mRNA interferase family)